jgi:hypothetical protein
MKRRTMLTVRGKSHEWCVHSDMSQGQIDAMIEDGVVSITDMGRLRDRIADLEAALRELLDHDDGRFGYEGEPSEVEKRCRKILEKTP